MARYENRIVRNRTSPANEDKFRQAYAEMNPRARRHDDMDIACVTAKNGEKGHVLLNESINRGKDRDYHRGTDFIPDKELKKKF